MAVVGGVGRVVDGSVPVLEADEASIFDAVDLDLGHGVEDPFVEPGRWIEVDAVGPRGQGAEAPDGPAHTGASVVLVLELAEAAIELDRRELLAQGVEHPAGGLDVVTDASRHAAERVGVEHGGRDRARAGLGAGGLHGDVAVLVDRRGPEADGGAVALADPAGAHDEAETAGLDAGLGGSRDERRVAERGGFDAVLVGERGAEEHPTLVGQDAAVGDSVGDPVRVVLEGAGEIAVAVSESFEELGETVADPTLVEGEHVAHRVGHLPPAERLGVPGHEQLGDHAGRVRTQAQRLAHGQVRGHAGSRARLRACCNVEISAMVDSAPWFRLGPVAWRPS